MAQNWQAGTQPGWNQYNQYAPPSSQYPVHPASQYAAQPQSAQYPAQYPAQHQTQAPAPSGTCRMNIKSVPPLDPRFAMSGIQADEITEILQMAKNVKTRSDSNKIWVYVAVGMIGHKVARDSGKCVPLRNQINQQLKLVNDRHAALGVSWFYEKETLVVTFQ